MGKTAIPHVTKLEFAIPLHTILYHYIESFKQQERAYSGIQVSPAWRLDRKMRRRLILQET